MGILFNIKYSFTQKGLSLTFLDMRSEKNFRTVITTRKSREDLLMTSWKLRNHSQINAKKNPKQYNYKNSTGSVYKLFPLFSDIRNLVFCRKKEMLTLPPIKY